LPAASLPVPTLARRDPGWLGLLWLIREEQLDLHGPRKYQHPTAVDAEAIPLLRERSKRGEQAGKLARESSEVVGLDAEVPVGPRGRAPFGS
jgi:hypothetical protein